MAEGVSQGVVLDADWRRMSQALGVESPATLSHLLSPAESIGDSPLLAQLEELPEGERMAMLTRHLQGELQQILFLSELPDPTTGFFDFGMDSLMAVELKNRLQRQVAGKIVLENTLIFDFPDIPKLSSYLTSVLIRDKTVEGTEESFQVLDRNDQDVRRVELERMTTDGLLVRAMQRIKKGLSEFLKRNSL
jgi:acyl carrier protein